MSGLVEALEQLNTGQQIFGGLLAAWSILTAAWFLGGKVFKFCMNVARGAKGLSTLGEKGEVLELLSKGFETLDSVSHLPDRFDEMRTELGELMTRVKAIEREVNYNGGSSVKDKIRMILEQLSSSQDVYRSVLSEYDDGVFQTDEQGRMVWANRAYLNRIGAHFDQVQGYGWVQFIHPDDREAVLADWENAVELHREFRRTFRMINTHHEEFCVSVLAYLLHSAHVEEMAGFLGFSRVSEECDK